MGGWRWLLTVAALFLFPCLSRADDDFLKEVTFNRTENARIVYTGLVGVAYDEIADYSYGAWKDYIQLRLNTGMMTDAEYNNALLWMSSSLVEVRHGRWWERTVFDSFPVEKGGLRWPPEVYYCGPRSDIIDTKLFRVTNTFRFKLKDYTATIAGEFDEKAKRFDSDGWRFRFSPSVSTGMNRINSVSASAIFNYFIKDRDLLRIECTVGYSRRQRFYGFFGLSIARW
jgi:hypothetical protein